MTHPRGIGPLQTAEDLREKLRHDLDRLRANPVDAYAAFDFFVTAHHLPEWWMHEPRDQAALAAFRHGDRTHRSILDACRDIANRAKHLRLTDDDTRLEVPGISLRETGSMSREHNRENDIHRLEVVDDTGARDVFEVGDLAEGVRAFWDAQDLTRPWSSP